jgi:uncharacterized protein YunC (DUF1805 family)
MEIKDILIKNKIAKGIEVPLGHANLVLLTAKKGYIMCGYLSLETAEKLGDAACIVRGVSTVEQLLNAKIVDLTSKAKKLKIKTGITAKKALEKLI